MKLLRFFSLAALTQLSLVVSQLGILPLQLRSWGTDATAGWYSAIAFATLATVADLGLRAAGHAELLQLVRPSEAAAVDDAPSFVACWSWIRTLAVCSTIVLVAFDAMRGSAGSAWHGMLIAASALELLLIVRVMYLDTLGLYVRAELSYLAFSVLKAVFSIVGIWAFALREAPIAALQLGAAVAAVLLQSYLAQGIPQIGLMAPIAPGRVARILPVCARTISEPAANWCRLSLPVLVLSSIAPAAIVTTYVASRALFGLVRASVQQIARVASVEFVRACGEQRWAVAKRNLHGFLLLGTLVSTGIALLVAADDRRLLSLWLGEIDASLFRAVAIPFCLGAPFYIYQIMLSLRVRLGDIGSIAKSQYIYLALAVVASGAAALAREWRIYLVLLLACDVLLALQLMWRVPGTLGPHATWASRRGIRAASALGLALALFWPLVIADPFSTFAARGVASLALSVVLAALALAFGTCASFVIDATASRELLHLLRGRRHNS
jgi:hypothetical protein